MQQGRLSGRNRKPPHACYTILNIL